MALHSVHCAEYLNDPERRMMIDAAARDDLLGEMASGEKVPFTWIQCCGATSTSSPFAWLSGRCSRALPQEKGGRTWASSL